jgi:hypothetical protein
MSLMSNVLITMLTLGKQKWIVIPDGVRNGQSDATAVNLSFSPFSTVTSKNAFLSCGF